MKELEFLGIVITVAGLIVTNMAGFGGGGTMVPVLQRLLNSIQKIQMRFLIDFNSSIFVASVLRIVINRNQRHPIKKGKVFLVDMNMIILMLPIFKINRSFRTEIS
jgi:hypothetical protein